MGSWFKGVILGLGVLLGLAPAREPPPMDLRIHRDGASLYASVELATLPGKELAELVLSRYALRLELSISAGPLAAAAWREISFDGREFQVRVSETGGLHRTDSEGAAWAIVSRFQRVPLGAISALGFPLTVKCKAALSLPGEDGYDPMLLWAYKASAAVLTVASLGSIPYY